MNKILDNIYHWMLINLPFKLMYKSIPIDNKSNINIPRWGYSNKQKIKAKKRADELIKNIDFE